ncbi:MAG: PQQ-dependent sugar dehydrogenase [Actinobacteria bacterium]|nr:PQQ-dependent sugar dehydrogenase [Actinomycetota bacterium]
MVAPTTSAGLAPEAVSSTPISEVKVRLTEVGRFEEPVAIVARHGHDALYVAERAGRVRVLSGGEVLKAPLVDLAGETTTEGERGLLGLAFSPEGDRLYLSFTDRRGNSRLDELTMGVGIDDIDLGSRRTLLEVDQPFQNHNGGHVVFGPDAMLYLGLGDGGGSGDPEQRAQNTEELLGKILRIDPHRRGDAPYGIPADNPFVDDPRHPGARGEIWAYGLRNPWRFSFDRANGDLWIGDVGQDTVEEVDRLRSGASGGANLGWDRLEGTHHFEGSPPSNAVAPVHEYGRSVGQAVTGGIVYRGNRIAGLGGRYVFGDLNTARLWALDPGDVPEMERHDLGVGVAEGTLVSFGEDAAGELYVVSIGGPIHRLDPAG